MAVAIATLKGAPDKFVVLDNTPRGGATKGFMFHTEGPFTEAELRTHLESAGVSADVIDQEIAAARTRPGV